MFAPRWKISKAALPYAIYASMLEAMCSNSKGFKWRESKEKLRVKCHGFKFHVDKLTLSKYIDLGLQMVPYVCFLRGLNILWG